MTTARETHLRRRLERIEAEIARRRDDEALTPSELQARYLRGAVSSTDAVGNASQRQAAYLRGASGER